MISGDHRLTASQEQEPTHPALPAAGPLLSPGRRISMNIDMALDSQILPAAQWPADPMSSARPDTLNIFAGGHPTLTVADRTPPDPANRHNFSTLLGSVPNHNATETISPSFSPFKKARIVAEDSGDANQSAAEILGPSRSQNRDGGGDDGSTDALSSQVDGRFLCNYCGRTFTRIYNLKSHELIHTGHRRFSCDICGISFQRNFDLKRHSRLHTNVRSFVCNCGQTFLRSDGLQRHLRTNDQKRRSDGVRHFDISSIAVTGHGDGDAHSTRSKSPEASSGSTSPANSGAYNGDQELDGRAQTSADGFDGSSYNNGTPAQVKSPPSSLDSSSPRHLRAEHSPTRESSAHVFLPYVDMPRIGNPLTALQAPRSVPLNYTGDEPPYDHRKNSESTSPLQMEGQRAVATPMRLAGDQRFSPYTYTHFTVGSGVEGPSAGIFPHSSSTARVSEHSTSLPPISHFATWPTRDQGRTGSDPRRFHYSTTTTERPKDSGNGDLLDKLDTAGSERARMLSTVEAGNASRQSDWSPRSSLGASNPATSQPMSWPEENPWRFRAYTLEPQRLEPQRTPSASDAPFNFGPFISTPSSFSQIPISRPAITPTTYATPPADVARWPTTPLPPPTDLDRASVAQLHERIRGLEVDVMESNRRNRILESENERLRGQVQYLRPYH
ncbi:hypothetical protein M427DRAFT_152364 [Gonapodya prolifera JEL478]|uniref:C2H2-type domain-containing protein n=1 Tax=Gonapodya prolifera (strain JEL478) TaxID=1344416 RepID=A0A139ATC5_GONPJ|nr:hypothetical protein M427DRAFT_152364 [Gonapodya prolifera JEL478]|eukprot:KXS19944.1 hypothetical protein M427DRAFT_152364 [Gonapodya prolifera JEL478]